MKLKLLSLPLAIILLSNAAPGFDFVPDSSGLTRIEQNSKTARLNLTGVHSTVTIRRDGRSIPHIAANNEEDLYFAQGYVTASDRLWQMDLLRRSGRGELAEIFGSFALEEDKQNRIYGFASIAEATVATASPRMGEVLRAYARGVNAFIHSLNEQSLPVEFRILKYSPRPWRESDSVIIGKLLSRDLSTTWPLDVVRASLAGLPKERFDLLFPETSTLDLILVGTDKNGKRRELAGPPVGGRSSGVSHEQEGSSLISIIESMERSRQRIGLYARGLAASNNWVVSGKRTASGKPLLANDPHLYPSAPSIWYMTHLQGPGVHVAGVTVPGAPGIIIGHNDRISWGATNLGADIQDLYVETFEQGNPKRYKTPKGWVEAEVRSEEIKVRKNLMDPTTHSVPFEVTVTRHGPIVLNRESQRYALYWTALDPKTSELAAFYQVNRARNWKEFTASLKGYNGPAQNFVYADAEGHIGYWAAGAIPIRKTGDGSVPYVGATDDGGPTRFIPFEKLPHLYNPPSGVIVTANNRVVGLDYPFFLTRFWAHPYRARRIADLLQSKTGLTAQDFRAIQGDTYSFASAIFTREAVRASAGSAGRSENKWAEVLRSFETWNGKINADSQIAPLVAEMRKAFYLRILTSVLGAERAKEYEKATAGVFLEELITKRPTEWLPSEFSDYGELLRACYDDAREALKKRIGADESKWKWEHYSKVNFYHPLAIVPGMGQQFTIRQFPLNGSEFSAGPTVNIGMGVSMRFIADPSDWDKTQLGLALGQSGDPSSPHWSDNLADWRAVTPALFPYSFKAITDATKETLVLEPMPRGGTDGKGLPLRLLF